MAVITVRSGLGAAGRLLGALVGLCSMTVSPARAWSPHRFALRHEAETSLAASGDAYVREVRAGVDRQWRFGTALVEKRVQLKDGHLTLVSFLDRATRHEYVQSTSDVIAFTWNGTGVTGRTAAWVLDGASVRQVKHGELMLRLALHTPEIAIVKCYLLYPKESIIQEWVEITNRARHPGVLGDPASLILQVLDREVPAVDFTAVEGNSDYHFKTKPLAGLDHVFRGSGNDYSPLQIYQNRMTHTAMFIGWDYIGSWQSAVGGGGRGPAHIDFRVAEYQRQLLPGDSMETPKAFTGVFHGDLDEMGHQLLDYQYRYKWDYTRAPYFPGTEMEPTWMGSTMGRGRLDPVTLYRQVFHMADLMREVGTDIYWRDFGWWDKEGDWGGPDWAETGRYLAQYGMQQIIYAPIQDAEYQSQVGLAHPDWTVGSNSNHDGFMLDQSQPAVIDWELKKLESLQRAWGNFQWRKDWLVTQGSSAQNLGQDQGFRRLVTEFLDRNPGMVFHGCAMGAQDLGYDFLGLAVSWSMNDGVIDRLRGYYASYLYPPEKLEDLPDVWDPNTYNKATWRGRLWDRFPTQGETDDPDKREGIRELFDIYHYALHAGVFGRWGWVYHPTVAGDSATWYLERLNGDYRRGMIIPSHALKTPVTIYPKGLLPHLSYLVSYQESRVTATRSGADLMAHGISIPSMPDGELIYLNLPLHPGSNGDHTPPTAPTRVVQQVATHMDVSGVEVRWSPGHDDNWISYYQIFRNGVPLAKVAKGTYYFDHALGADLAAHYAVATVDGSGNRSPAAQAVPARNPAALVVDDTSNALAYTGHGWEHRTGQWIVANGTEARSRTRGDAVSYTFEGNEITWYGRPSPAGGVAAVYLDGVLDRIVDTYDGSAMPGVAVYSRTFPTVGQHTLKIVVMGALSVPTIRLIPSPDSIAPSVYWSWKDSTKGWIAIDGVQVGRQATRVVGALPGEGIQYRGTAWEHLLVPPGPPEKGSMSGSMHSSQAGDQASYTFTGRGVTWVGRRCSTCGMADVYVDGRLETTVDTYTWPVQVDSSLTGDEQRHVPLFTRQWPSVGRHTITVVVRSDANLLAKGHVVYLDALHIIQ